MNDEVVERSYERAYESVCDFEKTNYEDIYKSNDGQIIFQVDKDRFLELENIGEEDIDNSMFEPIKFPSYKKLFNSRYKDSFKRNIKAIKPYILINDIGETNMKKILEQDKELRQVYSERIKEIDLDNDGVPDRIDIDDSRNAVQTVSDLSEIRNSTNKETERENKKRNEPELS